MFPSHQTARLFLKQNLTLFKVLQKCNFQCINFNLCFIQHAKKQNKAYLSYHLHPSSIHPSSILSHYPRLPQIQLLFSTFLPAIPFPGTKSKGRNVSLYVYFSNQKWDVFSSHPPGGLPSPLYLLLWTTGDLLTKIEKKSAFHRPFLSRCLNARAIFQLPYDHPAHGHSCQQKNRKQESPREFDRRQVCHQSPSQK